MKKITIKQTLKYALTATMALCLMLAAANPAQAKLPADMDEYNARIKSEAKTPEGAVNLWFDAIFLYVNSSTRNLGKSALNAITHKLPADFEKNSFHATFVNRMKEQPEIFRSYCQGATPENNYKADPDKCELTVTKSDEDYGDTWAVYIKSSGADSNRKIQLIKGENGLWLIRDYPGIYSGVKKADK